MSVTFRRPTVYTVPTGGRRGIGSFYGHTHRNPPSANPGTDYPCPTGTIVRALAPGRVVGIGFSRLVGWWVAIDYDNGCGSDFLHMSVVTIAKNARVNTGTPVGRSGATGILAIGAHLHASIRDRHGYHLLNRGNFDLEQHIAGALPAPKPKSHTISKESDIMRARSESSGTWYIIPEMAPPTAIPTGKSGSANQKHALAYNGALGGGFPVLTSEQIRALLDDNAARRIAFFKEQAAAFGLNTKAIEDGIAGIRKEIDDLKQAEPAGITPEAAALIAEQIQGELAEGLADALQDDLDGVVQRLQVTIPPATIAALVAKLGS